MEGFILDYNSESGEGLIRGKDEKRYAFTSDEWKSEKRPATQMKVDFEGADGKAVGIYVLGGAGRQTPGVNVGEIKDKFVGFQQNLSSNPTMKNILDRGVQNRLSSLFFLIAFLGSFTDMIEIELMGISSRIEGSSLAGLGIGWILPLLLISLTCVTALGYSKKLIKYLAIASVAVTLWQVYVVIDENFAVWRYSRYEVEMVKEFTSSSSVLFVVASVVLLIIGSLLPKKENPAFNN